jgi:hypothetical protein
VIQRVYAVNVKEEFLKVYLVILHLHCLKVDGFGKIKRCAIRK